MAASYIRMLGMVMKVDLVHEAADGLLTPFFDSVSDSPIMQSASLRSQLKAGMMSQTAPFLYEAQRDIFFAALHAEDGCLYMGPMCSGEVSQYAQKQMYASFGIDGRNARNLRAFPLSDIRNMILLTNSVLDNANLQNEELLQLNRMLSEQDGRRDQMGFLLNEEEENDAEAYRHSYYEEQLLMQAIKEGRAKEAIRLSESMDRDSGRLSRSDFSHRRNLAIIGITLCARAAIEGGLSPEEGYRISGYYIQKCDEAQDKAYLLHYRNRAIEEMTARVKEKLEKPKTSGYVERCKDYVRKHYREKIYLEEIAEMLELSPTYLSRLFRKETGQCLQDFINEERVYRASNLLMYSDLTLAEIAEYVHFPTQSYFGKVFKQYKHMSPKAFRDLNRLREAQE